MKHTSLYFFLCFVVIGLFSCDSNRNSAEGPTPIEKMLAADSAYQATIGDSNNRHINFDYANLNRVVWQKPDELLLGLGPIQGKTVVEIGSGTGFFTRRLAKKASKVIALDIDPGMLLVLDSLNNAQLDSAAYRRIDPRLVPADSPNLGDEEGDAALFVNTFMYIQNGSEYLQKLSAGLSPGSPVLIVDFKKKNTPVGPPVNTRMPLYNVEAALREAGFVDIQSDDTTLDFQYIVRGMVPE